MKPKIGEKRYVEKVAGGSCEVTVARGREIHNHREFYRVQEIPGALFLAGSLKTKP